MPAINRPAHLAFGELSVVQDSFARTADTNAYSAGDVIAHKTSGETMRKPLVPIGYPGAGLGIGKGANGRSGYIVAARVSVKSTDASWAVPLRIIPMTAAPAGAVIQDNGPYLKLDADFFKRIQAIDFPPLGIDASGSDSYTAMASGLAIPFVLNSADDSLYYYLTTPYAGIANPGSATLIKVELMAELYG